MAISFYKSGMITIIQKYEDYDGKTFWKNYCRLSMNRNMKLNGT